MHTSYSEAEYFVPHTDLLLFFLNHATISPLLREKKNQTIKTFFVLSSKVFCKTIYTNKITYLVIFK